MNPERVRCCGSQGSMVHQCGSVREHANGRGGSWREEQNAGMLVGMAFEGAASLLSENLQVVPLRGKRGKEGSR